MAANWWLMKSEPHEFSIDDLARDGFTLWSGVRNYQARNFMRDSMRVGDRVLFYHSSCDVPAVVGFARIASTAFADPTQFEATSDYHDPASTPENPRWMAVRVEFERKLSRPFTLERIKAEPALADMVVAKRGSRLSIQPVDPAHAAFILGSA
jgi:predicted RNA-binding protein with PUA-like domain